MVALKSILPALTAPPDGVVPAGGKRRRTRDLFAEDLKRAAHLPPTEDQLTHFLVLVADGVRVADAIEAVKMTRAGFEFVLRGNEAVRARYEDAKVQALYRKLDIETIEAVLADVVRGKFVKDALADNFVDPAIWYRLVVKDPMLKEMYDDACRMRAEAWGDDLLRISQDDSRDLIQSDRLAEDGRTVTETKPNNAAVQRDKLNVDSKKWLMGRLYRDRFGDSQKIDLEANVTSDSASRLESARKRKDSAKIKPQS
jgi:hypothetical protein